MAWSSRQRLYERLARRFQAGIYNYLRWLCRDADLAQDLTQQTFVQVWRHPPEVRGERALRAWVYRIARNEYLQHRRRAGIETIPLDDDLAVTQSAHQPSDPWLTLERETLRRAVRAAIARLPDAFREAIVLHHVEGLSFAQAAEILGIPKGTVQSRCAKAFALLRTMLAAEVACDEMQPSSSEPSR